MNKKSVLCVGVDNKKGKGEDCYAKKSYGNSVIISVFDGLGGRSQGTDKETGGRIASRIAAQITESILSQSKGYFDYNFCVTIWQRCCQVLKNYAQENLRVSRLKGDLTSKRLCSTIAIAGISNIFSESEKYSVKVGWIGDSRIYYLNPNQGLQQLTKDDLKENKDALEVIYQDPPMSKFLTADPEKDWQFNYQEFNFTEKGFILACTDGCFQYLSAPWEFEKLLLNTLIKSESFEEWQKLLTDFYEKNKQDDVTLLLCPLANDNFQELHKQYKPRLEFINNEYVIEKENESNWNNLKLTWDKYKDSYEFYLNTIKERDALVEQKKISSNLDNNREKDVSSHDYMNKVQEKNIHNQPYAEGIMGKVPLVRSLFNKTKINEKRKANFDCAYDSVDVKQLLNFYQQHKNSNVNGEKLISLCNKVLEIDNNHCIANGILGIYYYDTNQHGLARIYIEKIKELSKNNHRESQTEHSDNFTTEIEILEKCQEYFKKYKLK